LKVGYLPLLTETYKSNILKHTTYALGDASTLAGEEGDEGSMQSYAHPSATPTSLLQTLEHPPFEEHLMQHTLWPEVEKL
jgi:hypothetical protein